MPPQLWVPYPLRTLQSRGPRRALFARWGGKGGVSSKARPLSSNQPQTLSSRPKHDGFMPCAVERSRIGCCCCSCSCRCLFLLLGNPRLQPRASLAHPTNRALAPEVCSLQTNPKSIAQTCHKAYTTKQSNLKNIRRRVRRKSSVLHVLSLTYRRAAMPAPSPSSQSRQPSDNVPAASPQTR